MSDHDTDLQQDLQKVGEDIVDSVQKAIYTGDFSRLSDEIRKSVTGFGSSSGRNAVQQRAPEGARPAPQGPKYGTGMFGQPVQQGTQQYGQQNTQQTGNGYRQQAGSYTRQQSSAFPRSGATPYFVKYVNPNRGFFKRLFGALGILVNVIFWIATFVASISIKEPGAAVASTLVFGLLTGVFGVLHYSGRKDKKLANHYFQYGHIVGDRTYISIRELSEASGVPKEQVLADLQELRTEGLLPQAMLDQNGTTLMLTADVYQAYLDNRMARETEARANAKQAAVNAYNGNGPRGYNTTNFAGNGGSGVARGNANGANGRGTQDLFTGKEPDLSKLTADQKAEYEKAIREGTDYIHMIREANDRIPDDVMSDKLDRMEQLVRRIFTTLQEHPEKARSLRKLIDTYLPTVKKLLDAYIEMDGQKDGNLTNVTTAQRQIESAMDTLNEAFGKILDSMYQSMAMDVSTDIDAMKMMLERDGLTGSTMMDSGSDDPVFGNKSGSDALTDDGK